MFSNKIIALFDAEREIMKNGLNLLRNVPFLIENNYESVLPYKNEGANEKYFEDLQSCATILKKKYQGEVNGLWVIRVPSVDGGVQTIVRTVTPFETRKKIQLSADVFDYCCDELGYIITNDSIDGLNSIPIEEWIADGQVFAVFDSERV